MSDNKLNDNQIEIMRILCRYEKAIGGLAKVYPTVPIVSGDDLLDLVNKGFCRLHSNGAGYFATPDGITWMRDNGYIN